MSKIYIQQSFYLPDLDSLAAQPNVEPGFVAWIVGVDGAYIAVVSGEFGEADGIHIINGQNGVDWIDDYVQVIRIDGYELGLIYNPLYYNKPVHNVLGEHIASIDRKLGSISGGSGAQGMQGWQGSGGSGAQGMQGWQGNQGAGNAGPQGFQGSGGGGGAGWKVLFDIDFTSLSNQALNTDGSHTLSDGSVWTKSGSAKEGTSFPWAIVNGSGLQISSNSGDFGNENGTMSNDLTFPTIWPTLPLGTLTQLSYFPVKIEVIYGSIITVGIQNAGNVAIALEARNVSANSRLIAAILRHAVSSAWYQASVKYYSETQNNAATYDNGFGTGETPTQNAVLLECNQGLWMGNAIGYTANVSGNNFPTNPGASYRGRGITPPVTTSLNIPPIYQAVWTPDNWQCSIISGLNDPGAGCYVQRFRVMAFY